MMSFLEESLKMALNNFDWIDIYTFHESLFSHAHIKKTTCYINQGYMLQWCSFWNSNNKDSLQNNLVHLAQLHDIK